MAVCKNGHPLSKVGMIWTGTHFQCHACRKVAVAEAQRRYKSTAKGMLADVRDGAAKRGNR